MHLHDSALKCAQLTQESVLVWMTQQLVRLIEEEYHLMAIPCKRTHRPIEVISGLETILADALFAQFILDLADNGFPQFLRIIERNTAKA